MSDIDEKKPTGKAGKRKRNAEQRNRKSDQKQQPKADQLQSVKAQVDTVPVASTDAAPIEAHTETTVVAAAPVAVAEQAFETQADATIIAAEAAPVAAQVVSGPSAALMTSVEIAPVAVEEVAQHTDVMAVTADTLPVVSPYVSEPPATVMAPVTAPAIKEQSVAATPAQIIPEAAVAVTDVPVSLQTIANAYGDYTRKSLEQTKCYIDKLTGVRTLDQVVEVQTEFARQACETFVAEAQKISDLHRELARQRIERLEGLMSMGTQASRLM
jgi:Phasin protein